MGFDAPSIIVRTADGRNVTVVTPIIYATAAGDQITVPAGATSDGASTPPALWSVLPPFGRYWMAAVLHDSLYRSSTCPRERCDAILYEAMDSLGVDALVRDAIYEGARLGGSWAFAADRVRDLGARV